MSTNPTNGGIDRRTYLKLGASLPFLASVGTASGQRGKDEFVIGARGAPATLNPFSTGQRPVMAYVAIQAIYDRGIRPHPDTGEVAPWMFEEWTFDGEADIVARLRDDLSWHDGEPVTAEDAVFTMQNLPLVAQGGPTPVQAEALGPYRVAVSIDDIPGHWPRFLGRMMFPKHVWKSVDLQTYQPRTNGAIGSGAFELDSYSRRETDEVDKDGNVIEVFEEIVLETRHRYPVARDAPFLRNGPFVPRIRFRYFGSERDLRSALERGEIDLAHGLELSTHEALLDTSQVTAHSAPTLGYSHHSFNLRRVPFDDKLFRQFLDHVWDERYHTETSWKGTVEDGDLTVATSTPGYRPYPPDAPETERFKLPRGEDGEFDIGAARDFLRDADGVHIYSFGPVENDEYVTGDLEVRVNGQLLTEAHTDNDGTPGQGPLVFSRNSERHEPVNDASWNQWVANLRAVGVPVEVDITPFTQQIPTIYQQEDFDMFEMGWSVNHFAPHLSQLYGRWGADLDGDVGSPLFNPMGYTGADDHIEKERTTVDQTQRQRHIHDALLQIYEDHPTMLLHYDPDFQAVNDDWSGWLHGIDWGNAVYPLLNIRPGKGNSPGA